MEFTPMDLKHVDLSHAGLKARQRAEREQYPEHIGLRIHRALSWLGRADDCDAADDDARFMFLWIAFNAAYANRMNDYETLTAQKIFGKFIEKLVNLDRRRLLSDLVWDEFSSSIRILLHNKYVFGPFWGRMGEHGSGEDWQTKFAAARHAANKAIATNNTRAVLGIVFSRLYVLRNQLMHGGATYSSRVNRDQVRDCTNLMGKAVPAIISIMMDNTREIWGQPYYPVEQ